MVLKPVGLVKENTTMFENDVKVDGTQTAYLRKVINDMFENDVKVDGTQTVALTPLCCSPFENDVKVDGTQTLERLKSAL